MWSYPPNSSPPLVLLSASCRAGQPCVLLLSISYPPLVLLSCCCSLAALDNPVSSSYPPLVLIFLSSVVLMSSCCRALYAAVRGREQQFLPTNLFGVYACIIVDQHLDNKSSAYHVIIALIHMFRWKDMPRSSLSRPLLSFN